MMKKVLIVLAALSAVAFSACSKKAPVVEEIKEVIVDTTTITGGKDSF